MKRMELFQCGVTIYPQFGLKKTTTLEKFCSLDLCAEKNILQSIVIYQVFLNVTEKVEKTTVLQRGQSFLKVWNHRCRVFQHIKMVFIES